MDNQATEPSSLEGESITNAFDALYNPPEEVSPEQELAEKAKALQADETETVTEEDADTQAENLITVEVDGKKVDLTPEQVAEAYKSGLRQSDYSRKTAELAQERNTVQEQAKQERDAYAHKINNYAIQLEGVLSEQSQTNWQELLDADPVEYLKQQHLFQDRQAAYQNALAERQSIEQLQKQEQTEVYRAYIQDEQEKLLQKIPAWKDQAKAKAEQAEIKSYLRVDDYSDEDMSALADHRILIYIRKAMQFDKLIAQAPAATKKVALAPVRVERSGSGDNTQTNDARKTSLERLRRSGSLADATAAFDTLL